jgi:heme exporter protein C
MLAVITAGAALVLDLVVAPPDAVQGQAQRLMYVHVPAAWTAYLCFAVVFAASIGVLLGRGQRWDAYARAAAELGTGMVALAIAEGSLWGHLAWGVWWTWDPRLVTTALLLVLYCLYLAVRALPTSPRRASRRAALIGVVAFAQVPVVHFSVLWWRTLHQPPTLLSPEPSPPIDATMLIALLTSVVAFTIAAAWLVRRRVEQIMQQDEDLEPAPVEAAQPIAGALHADAPANPVIETRLGGTL